MYLYKHKELNTIFMISLKKIVSLLCAQRMSSCRIKFNRCVSGADWRPIFATNDDNILKNKKIKRANGDGDIILNEIKK